MSNENDFGTIELLVLCRIQLYAARQANFSHTFRSMGEVGLTICSHGGYKCEVWEKLVYLFAGAEATSAAYSWKWQFNGTKTILIGQSIRKLLMRTMQSTQREQTIVTGGRNTFM